MSIRIALPYRPPLDWQALLEFLALRAIPGVERVAADGYERTVALGAATGRIRVERVPAADALELAADLPRAAEPRPLEERVRRIFDLDADPRAIAEVLAADPRLAEIARAHPGLRVPGCWNGFELAVRAVLGQQVTVRGAATLGGRLVRAYGIPLATEGEPAYLFPTPAALTACDPAVIGIPRARAATLRELARAAASGRLRLEPSGDTRAAVAALTALPGIGDWTAQYVAMRALRDPDAFPASDLALRKAAADRTGVPSATALRRRAEAWRPWRAYAAIHLWKSASTVDRT